MPARVPPEAQRDVSETWRQYQADDHRRKVESTLVWFSMGISTLLTITSLWMVFRPDASNEQVKIAYGWIGIVLGASANMLRKP